MSFTANRFLYKSMTRDCTAMSQLSFRGVRSIDKRCWVSLLSFVMSEFCMSYKVKDYSTKKVRWIERILFLKQESYITVSSLHFFQWGCYILLPNNYVHDKDDNEQENWMKLNEELFPLYNGVSDKRTTSHFNHFTWINSSDTIYNDWIITIHTNYTSVIHIYLYLSAVINNLPHFKL